VLEGTRTAPPALAQGVSAFAPMGAEFSDEELKQYREVAGTDPLMFRVAHDSLNPRARSAPLAIFVNRDNPLASLSMDQVARIFATAADGRQIENWSHLGQRDAPIHLFGLDANTALARFLRHKIQDRPLSPGLHGYPQSADVVREVGRDPLAIGFAARNLATPEVKALALSEGDGDPPSTGSAEDLVAGRYPLDRTLYIFARRPLDPLVRDYLDLVLSPAGQSLIAAGSLGYLPLNAAELAAERAKLE
jgi:phosphate transport system substrate-binding protein